MSRLDKEAKFYLRLLMNKEKSRVLCAKAETDFAEALLTFLALPLGEIVKELENHYGDDTPHAFGSLTTLYNGLADLHDSYFWTDGGKQMLLNPISSFFNEPIKFFRCSERKCKWNLTPRVSMYYGTRNCDCGALLSIPMGDIGPRTEAADSRIFQEERRSFVVSDDLQMAPAPSEYASAEQTLMNLGIVVTGQEELMTVTLGYNDIMDLLKESLLSETSLTSIILHRPHKMNRVRKDIPLEMATNTKKMIVKAVVKRSDNKLVFVKAAEDFVEFLFSFLTVPLGGVVSLLGSNTPLKNIDNLYRSIANSIDDMYFSTTDTKNRLIKPDLPPNYLSKSQIFPLSEQMTPYIYFFQTVINSSYPHYIREKGYWMCFKDPKGDDECYVTPGWFKVTDDLTVKPWFVHHEPKIPSADLKELEIHIGLKEGLNILKSSLVSTSALTDGLINPFLKKQAEQRK